MADHNATTSQTLPAVTQTATGVTDFFSVHDVGTLSDTVAFFLTNSIAEIGDLSERIVFQYINEETHAADISESYEYSSHILYENTVTASETAGPVEWSASLSAQPLRLRDRVSYSVTLPIVQEMTMTEVVENSVTTAVLDQLLISETAEPSATFYVEATSTLAIDDRLVRGLTEETTSVLQISNPAPITAVRAYLDISNSADLSDAHVNTVSQFQDMEDEATLSNSVSFAGSVANNAVSSTMSIRSLYWAKDFGALAWVLNTETGGLGIYDNFGFDSFAEVNGVLYATSPEGVFALTGDTDDGRHVDSKLKTGFLDFGNDQTKRVSDLFIGYTGGQLEVDVETYDGPQEVYTYAMEERDADAPRNSRAKIGRGLSSRYWRFTLRNVDGADFQVYDVTAEVGTSKRRL